MAELSSKVLMPQYRRHSNGESERAKCLFETAISGYSFYDDLSAFPDYLVYASAETLQIVIPNVIEEMLKRNDSGNFLVYSLLSAIDDSNHLDTEYSERAHLISKNADAKFISRILELLNRLAGDPPIPIDRLSRLRARWEELGAVRSKT